MVTNTANSISAKQAKRDGLYWDYRYRVGSYKARKAVIRPYLMVASRNGSKLKLYDDGSHHPSKHQEQAMISKCKGWRQQERGLRRQGKPNKGR